MEESIKLTFLIFVSMIVGAIIGIIVYTDNHITPMDVYQGKTTLQYTIVDGVKVDSCVIFKEE